MFVSYINHTRCTLLCIYKHITLNILILYILIILYMTYMFFIIYTLHTQQSF